MKTSGRVTPAARAAAACSMASPAVMPLLRARHPARWILGPSARGSLNGMPISAAAQPASWAARSTSTVSSRRGKPAVTYGTRAGSPPSPPPCSAAVSRSPGGMGALAVVLADGADVLVAAARQTHHDDGGRRALGSEHLGDVEGVARLQGRDDPLEAAEPVERGHGLVVVRAQIAHPAAVTQGAVLRAHTRVVEAGADRVGGEHLAVLVLHEVALRAVEHTGPSAIERRRMFEAVEATAASTASNMRRRSIADGPVCSTARRATSCRTRTARCSPPTRSAPASTTRVWARSTAPCVTAAGCAICARTTTRPWPRSTGSAASRGSSRPWSRATPSTSPRCSLPSARRPPSSWCVCRAAVTRTSAPSASTTARAPMPPGERLTAALQGGGDGGLPALVPYVTAGFPRRDDTVEVLRAAQDAGCAAAEIGIPFSDPLADGPSIQRAGWRALSNGMTAGLAIEQAAAARAAGVTLPLVFMTYLNPVLSYGVA